ncbi:MAG: hypothetical protein HC905_05455 [Bacteroidales bacterium]|nr:hypothetical protein [Bacteroidales bacterium]
MAFESNFNDIKRNSKGLYFTTNDLRFMYNYEDTIYLENTNVILIKQEENNIIRLEGNIVFEKDTLTLKRNANQIPLKRAPLAKFILKETL